MKPYCKTIATSAALMLTLGYSALAQEMPQWPQNDARANVIRYLERGPRWGWTFEKSPEEGMSCYREAIKHVDFLKPYIREANVDSPLINFDLRMQGYDHERVDCVGRVIREELKATHAVNLENRANESLYLSVKRIK